MLGEGTRTLAFAGKGSTFPHGDLGACRGACAVHMSGPETSEIIVRWSLMGELVPNERFLSD